MSSSLKAIGHTSWELKIPIIRIIIITLWAENTNHENHHNHLLRAENTKIIIILWSTRCLATNVVFQFCRSSTSPPHFAGRDQRRTRCSRRTWENYILAKIYRSWENYFLDIYCDILWAKYIRFKSLENLSQRLLSSAGLLVAPRSRAKRVSGSFARVPKVTFFLK